MTTGLAIVASLIAALGFAAVYGASAAGASAASASSTSASSTSASSTSASSTSATTTYPITVTCVWKLDPASDLTDPWVKPQTFLNCTGVLPADCGLYQVDNYLIRTAEAAADLTALTDRGILHQPRR